MQSIREWALLIVFYLLLFQNALSEAIPIFGYVDEACAILGVAVVFLQGLRTKGIKIGTSYSRIVLMIVLFFVIGFAGNLIYRYQPWKAVLVDVFTNAKFFLSIVSGYVLFSMCETEENNSILVGHARVISAVLFLLMCADYVLHIFPDGGTRYGIRIVRLFYSHETYLVGAEIFLLTIMTAFYQKKNKPYIVMAIIVLISTLKGKAFAGAVTYIACVYWLYIKKMRIKLVHILFMILAMVIVSWDQIMFYFVELGDESARSALLKTSFQILQEYFPIGTGFGTFASATAIEYYSPLYYKYGLNMVWGLSESFSAFGSDSFWPIIIGQTGAIGTICFIIIIILLFKQLQKVQQLNIRAYTAGVFALTYTLISSFAETGFHNSVSMPFAIMIGYAFTIERRGKQNV